MNEREKFIAVVDNDMLRPSDIIVLLEGDGLHRVSKAVELFQAGLGRFVVFSGGIDAPEYGSFSSSKVLPLLIEGGIPESAIILEEVSKNTREQAIEIVNMMIEKSWKRMILVGSHYHQYRAYLTFLRVIKDKSSGLVVYNAPARDLPWFLDPGWGKRIDLLDNELSKIEEYRRFDHIASFESALEYQRWKEELA